MKTRTSFILAAYVFFLKNEKVLLTERKNTGYQDGNFSTFSGHVEKKETLETAALREVKEEAGIKIDKNNLKLFHIMSRKSQSPRFDFFYKIKNFKKNPKNNEPDLCSQIVWFDLKKLPTNIIPEIKLALKYINLKKISYSSYNW